MSLRRTPLYDLHVAAGGRMVEFSGWEMPVQYDGIVAEHKATRAAAGLFDVSHMGEFRVRGADATAWLDSMVTNNVATIEVGRCRYSLMCAADGGILDDLIISRLGDDELLLVVNAGNIDADFAWLTDHLAGDVALTDESPETALLAVQGPASRDILAGLLSAGDAATPLAALKYYRFAELTLAGLACTVSRTGYTGGLGYEVMAAAGDAAALWSALLEAGAPRGLVPVGLGARDTLRLEAGFCLHGHDISPARNPFEADLERFVDLAKGDFVGRDVLVAAAAGTAQRLAGFRVTGRGIIREHCPILSAGAVVGEITSGSFSPMLEASVGLGYVDRALAGVGTALEVEVRGRPVPVTVCERPFYKG